MLLPETFTQTLPSALLLSLVFGRVMPVFRCVCVSLVLLAKGLQVTGSAGQQFLLKAK